MTAAVRAQLAAHGAKAPLKHAQARPAASAAPVSLVAGSGDGTRKKSRHLEDSLQEACVTWFRAQYGPLACLLFAIPNGGQRNAREGARLKRQGTTAGVPDMLLAVVTNRAPGLFIELKVGRNKSSEAQRQMQMSLSRQGYRICIVYTFEQFRTDIQQHLGY